MAHHFSLGLRQWARSLILIATLGGAGSGALAQNAAPSPSQALFSAAQRGDAEALKGLLGPGSNVNLRDENGQTLLHAAVARYQPDQAHAVVRLLLGAGARADLADAQGRQPLHIAAGTGLAHASLELIAAGASVQAVDRQGWQPLHMAARGGNPQLAYLLYLAGAQPEAKTSAGQDAFAIARERGAAGELSIEKELDYMKVRASSSPSKQSALLEAMVAYQPMARMLRLADAMGISLDTPLRYGQGVFDFAVFTDNEEALTFLIKSGAQPRTGPGTSTPLCSAVYGGKQAATRVLLKMLPSAPACLASFAMRDALLGTDPTQMVPLLIELKVPLDPAGESILRAVTQTRDPVGWAQRLIAAGAQVNAVTSRGETPLHGAVSLRTPELVALLLAHGAKPLALDKEGKTPVDLAKLMNRQEALQLLTAATTDADRSGLQIAQERKQLARDIESAQYSRPSPERLGYTCESALAPVSTMFMTTDGAVVDAAARNFTQCVTQFAANPPQVPVTQAIPVYRLMTPEERAKADLRFAEGRAEVVRKVEGAQARVNGVYAALQRARDEERQRARERADRAEADKVYPAESSSAFLKSLSNQLQGVNNQMRNQYIKPKVDSTEFYARIAEQDEKRDRPTHLTATKDAASKAQPQSTTPSKAPTAEPLDTPKATAKYTVTMPYFFDARGATEAEARASVETQRVNWDKGATHRIASESPTKCIVERVGLVSCRKELTYSTETDIDPKAKGNTKGPSKVITK